MCETMPSKTPMFFSDDERQAHIEAALETIADGKSLLSYASANNIAYRTVLKWLTDLGTDANSPYMRAREAGTHALAEQCLEIADDSAHDVRVDADGNERTDTEVVQRAKLRIDTRLRLIGKWNRKDYGEKTQLADADGGKLDQPVVVYQLPDNGRDKGY